MTENDVGKMSIDNKTNSQASRPTTRTWTKKKLRPIVMALPNYPWPCRSHYTPHKFPPLWFCMDEGYMLACGHDRKDDILREGRDVEA